MSKNHPTEDELELTGLHASSEFDAPLSDTDKEITLFDRLIEKAGHLCAWLVLVAMLISVYEVVARYLFNSPTIWVHETTIFLVASIFALGGPYALARNRHIQINILHDFLPANKRKWLKLLNLVIGIGFCIAIGYAAWVLSYHATHTPTGAWHLQTSGSSWDSPLPAFTKLIILLSIGIMAVQLLVRLGAFFRRKP